MDFITNNETLHFEIKVNSDNKLIEKLRMQNEVQKVLETNNVDFEKGVINLYKGIAGFNVMFPIPFTNAYLVAYFNEKVQFVNVKVMKLKPNESQLEISFKDVNTGVEAKGIYQNGKYIRTEIVNDSDQVYTEGLTQCVEEGFESLPFALKAFCSAACTAIWTGAGAAACAGCLAGLGIHC
ncbi:hypothetical protein AAV35_000410 [Salimicrobium jeotgali]|uniref:Uncharacterized protein n=1 Tax=Salimicrobium jeotgali TaxID=1230341 RepID=K2G8W7_9BACI|nr:hypothetical protein [Salimicrobium jeotgali]AKG03394.1 hypothetical protein AAV35_000410 [Salimicrobium jeotgali]EKE30822.1 hypothetical protein MJ3_11585 [Salimicrobium jeotgali]MBM7697687.1 hypothetical protein [Salimicrobium jeotgali]